MAKVIIGVERAGTQEGAKLTPEAKARIIIRLYAKMGASSSEPRAHLVEAIRDEVEGQGLEDLFQLYLRHNHGCTDLTELSNNALPEALSAVTCWGFVLAGQTQASKSATG